ncbi:hypothetical protein [Paenibacillus protaetiae]|uniref:Multi-TM2 domain-containing protein n=1 Tax=Paenibacillus protaetiae TaxID=2509456 RepID=A0A4P6EZX1_9BACL|nr:hypothetical protein [Paenibacillus protaetiae]QAY67369.1 hypothetical protein ET464_14185 [Paenibacillus protaetiae]
MYKNPLVAFLLAFIPGAGHAYLGRPVRTLFYGGGFFFPLGLLVLLVFSGHGFNEPEGLLFLFACMIWGINMLDMIISLVSGNALTRNDNRHMPAAGPMADDPAAADPYYSAARQREKSNTIMLSFIPGLGHMANGLTQRGITFMISFFGLFAVIVFLAVVMDAGALLVFLLVLPILWIYSIFDAVQQLDRKQRGEPVEDRAIFADLEEHISSGRKNRVLALMLSFFPGAGHLYLGLQKRGLQLMAGFLIAVYLMDSLRLTLFLFMIPLIICFAFFDAIQQISRYERNAQVDEPLVSALVPYQKWLGIGLLGFGLYYLLDRVAAEIAAKYDVSWIHYYLEIKYMIPTAVAAFLMIVIGLRLLLGGKTDDAAYRSQEEEEANG